MRRAPVRRACQRGSACRSRDGRHRPAITATFRATLGALVLSSVCTLSLAQPAAPVVKLATLDWPPYTGQNVPHGGVSTQIVREAFDAVGYQMQPGYYPWSRAMSAISFGQGYVGYYPEYSSLRTKKSCLLSGPIGSSRLGFAQKKARYLPWNSVRDLSRYRIGVVRDYVNSEPLDAAISAGEQAVDEARDDAQNLRKLIVGRVDLAVIDAAVMAHLMNADDSLRAHVADLSFNSRLLEIKDLYVCFRKDDTGRAARDIFNAGLRKIGRPTPAAPQ